MCSPNFCMLPSLQNLGSVNSSITITDCKYEYLMSIKYVSVPTDSF